MQLATLLRYLRLASGLVLMAFVAGHIGNLALGLKSLEMMEDWRGMLMMPWQTRSGEFLLAGSALVHVVLGLYSLAARRSMALSQTDWVQLILGMMTPPLLMGHVFAMRVTSELMDSFEAT